MSSHCIVVPGSYSGFRGYPYIAYIHVAGRLHPPLFALSFQIVASGPPELLPNEGRSAGRLVESLFECFYGDSVAVY